MKKYFLTLAVLLNFFLFANGAVSDTLSLQKTINKKHLLLAEISIYRITDYPSDVKEDYISSNSPAYVAPAIEPYVPPATPDVPDSALPKAPDITVSKVDASLDGTQNTTLILQGDAISGAGNELDNNITGNAQDNILTGFAGKDIIDGREGGDRMIGGQGDDTYFVDNVNDVIVENIGEGTDIINSSIDYTLGDNQENLMLTDTASDGTGNGLDNMLIGNDLNNTLSAASGNDALSGGRGNDSLFGGNGNDKLEGGEGSDYLSGGNGRDTLTGGAGNDTFALSELSVNNFDTITDFSGGSDKISLDRAIFSQLGASLSSNEFRSGNGVTTANDSNDYLIYNTADGSLYYDQDGGGINHSAIKIAHIFTVSNLTINDFKITP